MNKFVIAVAFSAIALSGCTSLHRTAAQLVSDVGGPAFDHASGKVPKEAPQEYQDAVEQLEVGNFQASLDALDAFLRQNPTSPWTQAATLNAGRALEGLERWQEASEKYRAVVQATNASRVAPKLQAMALYRLSLCNEALGDDTQIVATLNDLLSRTQFLPSEIADAELPAKLAGAYARVGNFERAQEFYRRAEAGLSRLKQNSSDGARPTWLAPTLYTMGESSRLKVSWEDFESSLRPLARGQVYLLQAAELSEEPWSEKAADELIRVYDSLFEVIFSAALPPADDPVAAKRKLQMQQVSRIGVVIDLMAELRARFLPGAQSSAQAQKIQKHLRALDKRIQSVLLERPAGEGLTKESRDRLRLRPALSVVAPGDQTLEQQFINDSREATPKDAQVPAPQPTPQPVSEPRPETPAPIRLNSPSNEDPNL